MVKKDVGLFARLFAGELINQLENDIARCDERNQQLDRENNTLQTRITELLPEADFARSFKRGIPHPFFIVGQDKVITHINQAALELIGSDLTVAAVVGKMTCAQLFQSSSCGAGCHLEKLLQDRSQETVSGVRMVLKDKNGKDVPVSVCAVEMRDENGTTLGGMEIFQDISLQVKHEEEAKRTAENSMNMALDMGDLFNSLQQVAKGDYSVRVKMQSDEDLMKQLDGSGYGEVSLKIKTLVQGR